MSTIDDVGLMHIDVRIPARVTEFALAFLYSLRPVVPFLRDDFSEVSIIFNSSTGSLYRLQSAIASF